MERCGVDRGRDMSRPYPHVGEYPAQNERCGVHGVPEREEQSDDLPKMGEHEICIPQPRILVQGILRRHGGEEYRCDQRVHRKPTETGQRSGSNKYL